MHSTSRVTCIGFWLIVSCAVAVAPRAGGSETATTAGAGRTASAGTSAGGTTAHFSGSGLLCAGLLGSGLLGDVFTVAPMAAPRREDPNTAMQFGPIWSDAHQATVGAQASAGPPQSKPAVAIVKLPISFSETDRQKFAAAGWKPRKELGGLGVSYCLDRAGRSDPAASTAVQGMICVTAVQ
jgi:hypothetical protein